MAFALVHNRLLTPFVMLDHADFVGIHALIRRAAAKARKRRLRAVTNSGRRSASRKPSPADGGRLD